MGETTEEDAWEEDNLHECCNCEDIERQRDQLNKRVSELEEMRDRIVDFLIRNQKAGDPISPGVLFIINDDYQKIEKRKK